MRAFSLRTLLIAIAVVALWMVILGRPSLLWTRLTLTATFATLGWWLVMALAGKSERRRFGIGAATIGIGYLLIAFHSPTEMGNTTGSYSLGRSLFTHQILEDIARLIGAGYPTEQQGFSLWDWQLFEKGHYVGGIPPAAGGILPATGGLAGPGTFTFVPGASAHAKYQCYLISGHCLFALLFGVVAGSAAKRWLKSEADHTPPTPLPI